MDLRPDEDRRAPDSTPGAPSDLDVTVDLGAAPTPEVEPGEGSSAMPVAVVAGSGAQLSAETRSVLRDRLRAAALILFVAFALFLARRLMGVVGIKVLGGWPFLAYQVAMTIALGAGVALLSSRLRLSLRALRAVEVAVFGLVVAYQAVHQYATLLDCVERNDAAMMRVEMKDTLVFSFMLLVIYGTFILNTWRRAAAAVLPMALAPLLVNVLLASTHPEWHRVAARADTVAAVSENALILLIGVVIAVYGTHTINALRVEAFEARRLGQYQLGERIGAGGMGEVYLAEHHLLKRPCALKLIRPGRAAEPTALARFAREVRTTARLSHPNTIEIYDYGRTEDGTFYYVMEYLRGLSLADLVERHGPLPPGRVIYLLRQACEALSEAHAAGLIHRDLKPANIFAAERGGRYDFVKLLDFGLVKPLTTDPAEATVSRLGAIIGSPMFMAPEQATSERDPDARSDLYSLGAVAYFLLTGRPPFEQKTAFQVMVAHARDPVPPPSRLRPDVPEDLERIILRCLAKDPAERFPGAEGLERALASCVVAGTWDAHQAARWWREHPRQPAPSRATSPATTGA